MNSILSPGLVAHGVGGRIVTQHPALQIIFFSCQPDAPSLPPRHSLCKL
jgi:hypothetical protein